MKRALLRATGTLLLLGVASTALLTACGDDSESAGEANSPVPEVTQPSISSPPATTATSGGASVQPGIGSSCWGNVCIDKAGYITQPNPLVVSRGATISVGNPAGGPPVRQVNVTAVPPAGQPQTLSDRTLLWMPTTGTGPSTELRPTLGPTSVTFEADLAPGRYVVLIFFALTQGDVSYGLLLEVR